jgi:ApaG protein
MPSYLPIYLEVSYDISVQVKPVYLEGESSPETHKHVYAYFIKIQNMGSQSVRLLRRYWQIMDSGGDTHEIDGEGVIGIQPKIKPNGKYEYNSFCVLNSYHGSMQGYYTMKRLQDGSLIEVDIPKFALHSHLLN